MSPDLLERLSDETERRFRRRLPHAARAPGRVNLIGEHTDYNGGLALPCAIDRDTVVLAGPRSDGRVRVWARDLDREAEFPLDALAGGVDAAGGFLRYVQGIFAALAEREIEAGGWDLAISSSVPRESGLSSSAALGVALATALDHAAGLGLGPLECARLVHRAESHFVGVGCGILDPFASALSRAGCLLRIDCASEHVETVPFPLDDAVLLVAHSGVQRALGPVEGARQEVEAHRGAGDERGYGDRVSECAEALERVRASGLVEPSVPSLSALSAEEVALLEPALPARLAGRLRHVTSENARVQAVVRALRGIAEGGDVELALQSVGAHLREGQASLRRDFEVSVPELDALCEIADTQPACFGSRLTGAGFGGCTLHLVRRDGIEEARSALETGFAERFGRRPPVFVLTPGPGAGPV